MGMLGSAVTVVPVSLHSTVLGRLPLDNIDTFVAVVP